MKRKNTAAILAHDAAESSTGISRWHALVAVGVAAYEEEQRKAATAAQEKLKRKTTAAVAEAAQENLKIVTMAAVTEVAAENLTRTMAAVTEAAAENSTRATMAVPEAFYYQGHYAEFKTENINLPLLPMKKKVKANKQPAFRVKQEEKPTQPLPEAIKQKIIAVGGLEPSIMLLFKKTLTRTDVDPHQNRLLMPFTQVTTHSFLTQQQKNLLEEHVKVPFLFIDPACNATEMNLARWDMHKETKMSSNYALVKNWYKAAVKENNLKEGDFIQLWHFKRDSGDALGFALARYPKEETCINN